MSPVLVTGQRMYVTVTGREHSQDEKQLSCKGKDIGRGGRGKRMSNP